AADLATSEVHPHLPSFYPWQRQIQLLTFCHRGLSSFGFAYLLIISILSLTAMFFYEISGLWTRSRAAMRGQPLDRFIAKPGAALDADKKESRELSTALRRPFWTRE